MFTEKLYWENSYIREFKATVVGIEDKYIILDRTAFYPQGGGEVGDVGTIDSIDVLNTIKRDDTIYHEMEDISSFYVGKEVQCKIDWERRSRIMKHHSASHIVEYFILKNFPNVKPYTSGMVDEWKDRQDYLTDRPFNDEEIKNIEKMVNSFISEDREIIIWFDEYGIRHWKCGEIKTKCAGMHVKRTGEIGKVTIKKGKKPGKGRERIERNIISENIPQQYP